jgi:hypothetical protein
LQRSNISILSLFRGGALCRVKGKPRIASPDPDVPGRRPGQDGVHGRALENRDPERRPYERDCSGDYPVGNERRPCLGARETVNYRRMPV